MRIMGILVLLTLIAFATNCKALGMLVLIFIIGCALFGVGDFVKDLLTGGCSIRAQRQRQFRDNPERVTADFERWRAKREARQLERNSDMADHFARMAALRAKYDKEGVL